MFERFTLEARRVLMFAWREASQSGSPTTVDLPLSHECKRVLAYGAQEAERNHKPVGTEHLLPGLLREEKCFAAAILRERGLRLEGGVLCSA